MSQETHVQRAFQATASLFRALGVSQQTASRELGLRGHTSFSFWKQGHKEFEGRYAVALYKLVADEVNTRFPKKFDDQKFVTDKLIAVFNAWEAACAEWRKDANDSIRTLQQTAARIQQFGDEHSLTAVQERQRITSEIAQLNASLQEIGQFEAAWERGRMQILEAIEDVKRRHEAAKAEQPPAPKPTRPRRRSQRKVSRRRVGA